MQIISQTHADPQKIRKNFETSLAFFSIQRLKGVPLNLEVELGTKLSFAEFLIKQREFAEAEAQICEAKNLVDESPNSQSTLQKCDQLANIVRLALKLP